METLLLANIIGYVGAFFIGIIFIPQIIHIYQTKEVNAISYITQFISIISSILMCIYGFLISSIPIIISNILVGSSSLIVCLMKYSYKKVNNEIAL